MKDSFEFAEFIRPRQIPNTEEMVSFDVKILFTNILTNEKEDIMIKDLYSDNKLKIVTKITQNNMQKLLKICVHKKLISCVIVSFMKNR